jgi:hypothetical protein
MADRNGLGILGCIFGGITFAVAMMAIAVVLGHVDGSRAFDASPRPISVQQ